ncbi:sporulation protein YjcZ [bacterium]|nr:sporulation protein YjcZ [bacterium]
MSCPNSNNECKQNNQCSSNRGSGNGFVCIIVLYILLAIILGSFVY